jgi:hypothetical protein
LLATKSNLVAAPGSARTGAPARPKVLAPPPVVSLTRPAASPAPAPPDEFPGAAADPVDAPGDVAVEPVTALPLIGPDDDSPTVAVPAPPPPTAGAGGDSPLAALQRALRRQPAAPGHRHDELIWQPRFAYGSAVVILFALALVSLPLWIVLYRITDSAANPGGPPVADLVALCMMLLGGFLTAAAAWVIVVEMRGRIRMVDTLARSGEREWLAAPELPRLETPLDYRPAAARAEPVDPAAAFDASSRLLSSFNGVLRSFGQLPAQVAMLAVALALFVGATILSLN